MATPTEPVTGQDALRAAHSTALVPTPGGDLPEWIQLLPAGTFAGVDGRGPYSVPDPETVIQLTREMTGGNDLPIDYGHALEVEGYAGDAAPAAGWISDFEVRDGGEIWGRVTWTDEGAVKIRGKSFRFLSPVFYHTADGLVRWILRAGLTNRPNLRLKAVHSQRAGEAGEEQRVADKNSNALAPVASALGLEPTADEAAIVARCSQATQAQSGLTRVAHALQLAASATVEDIVAAVNSRGTPDPAQYVSRHSYDQVATELRTAQAREGERLVDSAIASGKLTPGQREWARSYHARDPQGFQQFVEGQPVVVQPSMHGAGSGGGAVGTRELDADAKAVCATLGISAEEYLKNVQGEG